MNINKTIKHTAGGGILRTINTDRTHVLTQLKHEVHRTHGKMQSNLKNENG